MKKFDFGQTVTVLANVGVIAGIVFLGYELRQNNELLRTDARRGLMENRVEANKRLSDDAQLMPLRLKAARGEPLTEEDEARLYHDAAVSLTLWEWEWEQFDDGLVDELPVDGYRSVIQRYPHIGSHLTQNDRSWSAEFVEWMQDNVLEEQI